MSMKSKFLLPLVAAGVVSAGSTSYASGPDAAAMEAMKRLTDQMDAHSAQMLEGLTQFHEGVMSGASPADLKQMERQLLEQSRRALEAVNAAPGQVNEIFSTHGADFDGAHGHTSAVSAPDTSNDGTDGRPMKGILIGAGVVGAAAGATALARAGGKGRKPKTARPKFKGFGM